jgi:hypothetical protein
MFPHGVRSDASKSISNESNLKLHLNSLLIFLLTSVLAPSGNIVRSYEITSIDSRNAADHIPIGNHASHYRSFKPISMTKDE